MSAQFSLLSKKYLQRRLWSPARFYNIMIYYVSNCRLFCTHNIFVDPWTTTAVVVGTAAEAWSFVGSRSCPDAHTQTYFVLIHRANA